MDITFEESARGVSKELMVTLLDNCPRCKGSGNAPGTRPDRCTQCHGTGMETVSTGPFMMRTTCRKCHGKGNFNRNPCGECKGSGQVKGKQKVIVPVPPGIENGQTVRMPVGKREIFITFRVAKSNYFRRQGADVHTDANISIAQAALGGTIRVKGVHEDLNVQIQPGTGSHTRLKLAGKGIQKVSGYGFGDHYIHIKVQIPKVLDAKKKAILQAYAETEMDTPGTVNGFTYDKKGHKVIMEDSDGLVTEIRDALEQGTKSQKEKENAS